MTAAIATCPLPGCSNSTPVVGRPCDECLALFGPAIQQSDGVIDEEKFRREQEQGDRQVRLLMAERQWSLDQTPYSKASQTCWLCEQRRSCTRTPEGLWECRECQGVM